jgi:aspartyl-tRNA(Asn)/glutamyl-tRNA(Gln) amidotransferase subunit C
VTVRIDRELVEKVARLAQLELTPSEAQYYETQLAKILEHIAQLASMPDPLGASWRADTLGEATPERQDQEVKSLAPEDALAAAPRILGTAFQVPRIIE